ncbi:MAG: radical SAM protein [Candidatus Cloacimonetes bacterium]|jgi:radical SAM superfamily enzyme YgiQ (UPF0313 family)|nr:radical SAM protein [Candidatus Cloacimonadota bacterium]MBT6994378.1 radical SAM protein [Candidatus Cloacimonadota bacterium]MBT7468922.1 radical SAM protein [Candidatus Cloacimonadota bacterium]
MYNKILFTQFSILEPAPLEYKSNIPLAAGYLIGFSQKQFPETEFIITPRIFTDILSENYFADYVQKVQPELLIFSLYLWNIEKTLRVVADIKKLIPKIEILFGGPEVNSDNEFLLKNQYFETGISGEGEIPFANFLAGKNHRNISGFLTKDYSNKVWNFRTTFPPETNPYLANLLEVEPDETIYFETVRGCPFKCNFCYYNKVYDTTISTDSNNLPKYFEYAKKHNFKEIFLLDPSFNVQPNFDDILSEIIKLNKDKQFEISTELRADFLNDNQIKKLKEMNLTEAEIGLQTTNPIALKTMQRTDSTIKTIEVIKKMTANTINCKTDLIVGLPGDTLANFKKSVDEVFKKEIYDNVQVFRLSVLSGTEFSKNKKKLGIISEPLPPYYIKSTNTFSEAEILEAIQYAEEVFAISIFTLPPYFLSTNFKGILPNDFVSFNSEIRPIHKIIFENYTESFKNSNLLYAENLTLHFIISEVKKDVAQIISILNYFSEEFSNNIFQIILEFTSEVDSESIYNISQNLPINHSYLDRDAAAHLGEGAFVSTRFAIIFPQELNLSNSYTKIKNDFDVFLRIENLNNIDELYEENNLFITGKEQNAIYDYLNKNAVIDEFVIFDFFEIEQRKIGKSRKYFPNLHQS